MPLIRRIPKRGFNNTAFKISYAPVNVETLEKLDISGVIDEAALRKAGLVNGTWDGIKILGDGDLKKKISVKVNAISAGARAKIEKAGGEVSLIVKIVQTKKPKADKPKTAKTKS